MAILEMYMQTTGSNLNAGTTTSDTSAQTYASGTLATVTTTVTFTVASGNPVSDGVVVGDWVSLYPNGSTVTPFVSKVTAVTTTTIVCDSVANKFGVVPADGVLTRTAKTGGAWGWGTSTIIGTLFSTANVVIPTRVNVKAGTYANTTTVKSFGTGGATTTPLMWRGYKTVIGDQDGNFQAVAGTDIPSFTFTTGYMQINVGATHIMFQNMDITGAEVTATVGQLHVNGGAFTGENVRVTNTAANANSTGLRSNAINCTYIGCYIKATTTAATACQFVTGAGMQDTYIGGGIIGLQISGTSRVIRCILDSPAGDAITSTGPNIDLLNSTIYSPLGNGINFISGFGNCSVVNCYFDSVNQAAKTAITNTSGTATDTIRVAGNTYYNCTATTAGLGDFPTFSDTTVASSLLTNPGSLNFSIKPLGWGIGFPAYFANLTAFRSFTDPGAVAHFGVAGPLYNANLTGGVED